MLGGPTMPQESRPHGGPLAEMPKPGSPRPPAPGGLGPHPVLTGSGGPHPGVVAAAPSQAVLPIWRGQRH